MAQQFLFQRQWQKVRNYAQMKGISIMGDMPIYVGYHSADVWANKKQFLLVSSPLYIVGDFNAVIMILWLSVISTSTDFNFTVQNRNGFPVLVGGVPPDAFSETGQLWDRFGRLYHAKKQ